MTLWKYDGKLVMTLRGHYVSTACSELAAKLFCDDHNREVTEQTKAQIIREGIERDERERQAPNRDNW